MLLCSREDFFLSVFKDFLIIVAVCKFMLVIGDDFHPKHPLPTNNSIDHQQHICEHNLFPNFPNIHRKVFNVKLKWENNY